MNFELLKPFLGTFLKLSLSKQRFYITKVFPVLFKLFLVFVIISTLIYIFFYSKPDQFIEEYQSYVEKSGYSENAWDCLHSSCRKKFLNMDYFKQIQSNAIYSNVKFEKEGSFSSLFAISNIIPKKRDYIVRFKKQQTISANNLKTQSGSWLFAKNSYDYYAVVNGSSIVIDCDYVLKIQVKYFEDIKLWKITSIDTISVKVNYYES